MRIQKKRLERKRDEQLQIRESSSSPGISLLELKLSQAMRKCPAIFDPLLKDCPHHYDLWLKISKDVNHYGPVGELMKLWDKLVTQYYSDRDAKVDSEIFNLLKFVDESRVGKEALSSNDGQSEADTITVYDGAENATELSAQTDEVFSGSPRSKRPRLIDYENEEEQNLLGTEGSPKISGELAAFGNFVGSSLSKLTSTKRDEAMDRIYDILKECRAH